MMHTSLSVVLPVVLGAVYPVGQSMAVHVVTAPPGDQVAAGHAAHPSVLLAAPVFVAYWPAGQSTGLQRLGTSDALEY